MREVGRSNRLAPTIYSNNSGQPDESGVSTTYRPVIVIPAFNAAKTLPDLISDIRLQTNLSIIVVDDGSVDSTSKTGIASGCAILRLPRNFGKGAALSAGFRYAQTRHFTHAITIDADGQHDPADLQQFLNLDPKLEFVLGVRKFDSPMPVARRLSNTLTSVVLSIATGEYISDSQCGYRRYLLSSLSALPFSATGFSFESEILFAAGSTSFRILGVPIATIYQDEPSAIQGLREIGNFLNLGWKFLWR